ncbi:hypothetical protein LTSEWAN_0690, partial [Salmonella enterica subsp. enterica serovar Wandsworth str. A4-580]
YPPAYCILSVITGRSVLFKGFAGWRRKNALSGLSPNNMSISQAR